MTRLLLILILVLPQDAGWKAGFARARITPDEPLPMAGYAARSRPFERVAGELFVKAMALEDGRGRKALLITADHIGWSADYAIPLGGARRLVLLADVFNLFDSQQVVQYDNYTEISFQAPNPDFGTRLEYQAPRRLRVGARFTF